MIGILHLSDIHIKSDKDKVLDKCEAITNSIQNEVNKLDKLIILVTGDIAFSGINDQYEIAYCFLDDIKNNLQKKIEIDILTCPGNHDCKFSDDDDDENVRDTIIEKLLETNVINNKIIDICCEVQDEYFEFDNVISESKVNIIYTDKLLKINKYNINEQKIYFIRLNTSWISHKKEVPSKIYFPIKRYEEIIKKCSDGVVISYFHHPSNWCHPNETNYLDDKIESISDFVFLGHEHTEKEVIKECGKNKVVYIKGDALQENEKSDTSGFSFMIIDSNKGVYKNLKYSYKKDIYYQSIEADWKNYNNIKEKKENKYKLSDENINFLTDVGVNLNHPRKDKLSLTDIFVYPNLEIININQKEEIAKQKSYLNSKNLMINENTDNHILILGEKKFGKTGLAKKLYLDYFNQELCPIYINGLSIKNKYCNNIEDLVLKVFSNQYIDDKKEYFKQLDNNKKIIMIDDIDKIRVPPKLKQNLIANISAVFPNVILFSNALFDIEELLNSDNEMIINTMYKQYTIKNFGYTLKNELIHKWNIMGQKDLYDDEDLISKDDETFRNISTIIGNNYMPSVPFYLLIILQALESGNEHSFKDSAYGHYYEFLIFQTLNKISDIQGDVDAIKNFIVMLAREFYNKSITKISEVELKEFHEKFCNDYRISRTFKKFVDFDSIISNLCIANILKYQYGTYKFSYDYIYYYCIGKYFAENIFEEETKNVLSQMISKLYIEENANTVLFIIHHTKNSFIIKELINNSKDVFIEHECVKIEDDIAFVNDLQCEVPKLIIGKINLIKERAEKFDKLDKAAENINTVEQEIASTKEIESSEEKIIMNKINQLNFAFKSMEILGQVLKNYWGSLEGIVRKEIGKELYLLGLRSLREIYKAFESSKNKLAISINRTFEERNIKDPEKRQKKTKQMLFIFVSLVTQSYIYKIASCIGDDKLSETFNDIEDELDFNSVRLVNLAIKLEFFNEEFPYSYAENLIKSHKNNFLSDFLIKNMIREYLYMYKTSAAEKSKIASLIGASIKDINIHEIESIVGKK
ncbi:STAND family AAA ATPase [Clostridium sp. DL1XJH146]